MKNNTDTLVTILTASLIHEIHIAKTVLASYKINSFIFDEHLTSTIGTAFVEGHKLKVSTLDFEKASIILAELNTSNK